MSRHERDDVIYLMAGAAVADIVSHYLLADCIKSRPYMVQIPMTPLSRTYYDDVNTNDGLTVSEKRTQYIRASNFTVLIFGLYIFHHVNPFKTVLLIDKTHWRVTKYLV